MKKFFSIVLLFSSLSCQAAVSDWVLPVALPLASKLVEIGLERLPTAPSGSTSSESSTPSENKFNKAIKEINQAFTEGSTSELAKRAVLSGLAIQKVSPVFAVENDWKSVSVDSSLNAGALVLGQKLGKYLPKKLVDYALTNPLGRTVLVLALKNTLHPVLKSALTSTAKPVVVKPATVSSATPKL